MGGLVWYPTKTQWSVIWTSTVVALVLWLAKDPDPESFPAPVILVAALFLWQVFQGERTSEL